MRLSSPRVLAVVALPLALCGCVELNLHIKIEQDGSATVTETVHLSEQVLDMAATLPANKGLEILLKKDRAEERVALMGKGAKLVSHKVTDVPGGAKECVTVYKIPDINALRVVSPAVAYLDYETAPMQIAMGPHYTDGSGYNVGKMHVYTRTLRSGKRYPRENSSGLKPRPTATSPADLQKYRDIIPIFRDLMKDFSLTCRIECYAPVRWATRRNTKSNTHDYFVMQFSDQNLDQWGGRILENEEFMLALIRWDLRSGHITNVVRHCQQNLTVPVWSANRGMSMRYIAISPSKFLFNKYFKGKPRYFGGDLNVKKPSGRNAFKSRAELIKWGIIKPKPKPNK